MTGNDASDAPDKGGETPGKDAERRRPGRREARLAAVQALYQIDFSDSPASAVVEEFLAHRLRPAALPSLGRGKGDDRLAADPALFREVVMGVEAHREEMDDHLRPVLPAGWPLERLDRTLVAVLRAGAYELAERLDMPPRAAINEYVEIAKAFFDDKEPGLVNGILDGLARRLRPQEMEAAPHAPVQLG